MFGNDREAKRFQKRAKALVKKAKASGRDLNGRERAEVERNAGRAAKVSAYADADYESDSYNDWD